MQVTIKNVQILYTNHMTREGNFGGYSYSIIMNMSEFLTLAKKAIESSKKVEWKDPTDKQILKSASVKFKEDVPDYVAAHMTDNDILITINSKKNPIIATRKREIPWFSIADVAIELYACEYQKRKFVCRTALKGVPSVRVTKYAESTFTSQSKGFELEDEEENTQSSSGFELEDDSNVPF